MWNLNVSPNYHDESNGFGHVSSTWLSSEPLVTRNFFPGQSMELRYVGQSDPGESGQQEEPEPEPEITPPVKKSRRGPRSRSSQYRGVTFYRRTGRWESHIWDYGKQVYLGGFDTAHAAARAYDRAAIKFRGIDADINFDIEDYMEELKQMSNLTKEEFMHVLRRQNTGIPRGSSRFIGVALHKCQRWEARLGQFLNKKAYDKAAIKCNGKDAVTNFDPKVYEEELSSGHNLDLSLGGSNSEDSELKSEIASRRDKERLLGRDLSLAISTTKIVRSENQSDGRGKPTGMVASSGFSPHYSPWLHYTHHLS